MIRTMKNFRPVAGLLCAMALGACEKNTVQDITAPLPASRIKFHNFAVGAPGVNFYANEAKMTAISSTTGVESTNGVAYAAVGNGGLYSGIAPGSYTLSGKIAAATDKDLAIAKTTTTIEDGKAYSFYTSGVYNTVTKSADAFVVEDPLPTDVDFRVARVRFVNAISGSNPAALGIRNQTSGTVTAVGGDVAYKAAGAFVSVPAGVYDLAAIFPGAGVSSLAAVSLSGGRIYTVGARGDIKATTGATVPTFTIGANR